MTETEEKRLNLIVKRINDRRRGNPVMNLDAMKSVQDDIISTGLPGLDDALGVGGFRQGSIIEIFGDEGTGKIALALRKLEYLKNKGNIIGIRSRVKVVKNKISTPYGETSIDIIFGQGVKAS